MQLGRLETDNTRSTAGLAKHSSNTPSPTIPVAPVNITFMGRSIGRTNQKRNPSPCLLAPGPNVTSVGLDQDQHASSVDLGRRTPECQAERCHWSFQKRERLAYGLPNLNSPNSSLKLPRQGALSTPAGRSRTLPRRPDAVHQSGRKLLFSLALFGSLLVFGTLGYYSVGRIDDVPGERSLLDAFYFTLVILTTVGMESPVSTFERIFSIVLMLVGIFLVAAAASNVVAFAIDGELNKHFGRRKIGETRERAGWALHRRWFRQDGTSLV